MLKLIFSPRPRVWFGLITVLLISIFVYLGFWQLERMAFKEALQKERTLALESPPITIQELDIPLFRYRQLTIKGKFLNDRNVLLDNQILKGQAGYRVLTPLQAEGKQSLILVDRGFIPAGPSRNILPKIPDIRGNVQMLGRIDQLSQGIVLKEDPTSAEIHWPIQIQKLDYEKLSRMLEQNIYPFILQLPEESPYVFQVFPFSLGLSPKRHLGYAIQWFALATTLLVYFGFRLKSIFFATH